MKTKLANLIKTKRKNLHLSQKALAEGICTQTIISRLEKEEVTPSIDIFFKIVKKLDIPMNEVAELFDISIKESDFYNTLYTSEIEELLYKRDYKTLSIILSSVNNKNLDEEDSIFYDWINSILTYHIDNKLDLALAKLQTLLEKTKEGTLIYCNILNTIGNLYSEKNLPDVAMPYFQKIIPYHHLLMGTPSEQSFYYGIARIYMANNELNEATKWNSLAISKLLEAKSFKMLGDNYFLQAFILERQKLYTNAMDSCNKAINFFILENNEEMKIMALSFLSHLKEKTNEKL